MIRSGVGAGAMGAGAGATTFVLTAAAVQWLAGTAGDTILAALALMFPASLLAYTMNRLCKRFLRKQRPNRLYDEMGAPWVRGSFPSFHSQFGAALGATFCTSIALLAPEGARLQAAPGVPGVGAGVGDRLDSAVPG